MVDYKKIKHYIWYAINLKTLILREKERKYEYK